MKSKLPTSAICLFLGWSADWAWGITRIQGRLRTVEDHYIAFADQSDLLAVWIVIFAGLFGCDKISRKYR
jgi:hypothetical protein